MQSKTRHKSGASRKFAAISMLMQDHRKVKKSYKQFQAMEKHGGDKRSLIKTTCDELTVHMQLEEELFYPAVKPLLKEDKDLLTEAKVEHQVAKDLIAGLASSHDSEQRDAMFTVLCEYINHHVEEEEEELFPKIRRTRADLSDLALDMRHRKHELSQEYGLKEDEGEVAKLAHARHEHRRGM